jgi:hypothetical protein
MMYGFLDDTCINAAVAGLNSTIPPRLQLSDNGVNYFNTPTKLSDTRTNRLSVVSGTDKLTGDISIWFDADRLDGSMSAITQTEIDHITNVVEYAMYIQGKSDGDINTDMFGDSNYDGYQNGTINRSAVTYSISPRNTSGAITIDIPSYIEFDFEIQGVVSQFKIWSSDSDFLNDYPLTTICDCIHPCDPALYTNMSGISNQVEAISVSAIYSNAQYHGNVMPTDHSGVVSFITRYCNSNYSNDYNFSFGIIYKGRVPTYYEMRAYVRDVILALDPAITVDVWKLIFPDLFIDATFWLIPQWWNYQQAVNNFNRSITKFTKTLADMKIIFNSHTEAEILQQMEFMSSSADEILIATMPDISNDAVEFGSISKLHPTYIAVDATTPAWDKQLVQTKEFNIKLSDAIGMALGGTAKPGITLINLNGYSWYSFVSNFVEYNMIHKSTYPGIDTYYSVD